MLQNALELNAERFNLLDVRLTKVFSAYETVPVHEYARFILNQCIRRPGALLNEDMLAAKLGIDIKQSADWSKLCETYFEDCKYNGVFHEAWPRWWWRDLQHWWNSIGASKPMSRFTASERVSTIVNYTNLKELHAAKPIQPNYSLYYDTICQHYKRPLDRLDGIIIDEPEPTSWQEHRYLSIESVLSREYQDADRWRPSPLEFDRLDAIRQAQQG